MHYDNATPDNHIHASNLRREIVEFRSGLNSLNENEYQQLTVLFQDIRTKMRLLHAKPQEHPSTTSHSAVDWFYDYVGNRLFSGLMLLEGIENRDTETVLNDLKRVQARMQGRNEEFRLLKMDLEFFPAAEGEECDKLQASNRLLATFQEKANALAKQLDDIITRYESQVTTRRSA
ncbi:MAG: hypothetical protein J0M34_04565 [Alphaproteobacteria bacterium]|nr:hypothetical protein [Alphaproteobacteria bacterium]